MWALDKSLNKSFKTVPLLAPQQRLVLIDVIDALQAVNTPEQFIACTSGLLQRVLPHARLVCGIGGIGGERVEPYNLLLHNFPRQYIDELRQPDGTIDSPLMQRWRSKREPVLVELECNIFGVLLSYIARVKKYGFKNAAVHGMVDVQGAVTSYFCFTDIPEKLGPRHTYILNFLIPHLHVALTRCTAIVMQGSVQVLPDSQRLLTERQKNILHWIYKGKTNWEISKILDVSEDTIKYHITHILSRLSVTNRMQAVTKALHLNIIDA